MADKVYTSDELADWLFEKASHEPAARARKILMINEERGQSYTIVGKLYFFRYDPLWKNKLTQYDKFPMCFALEEPNHSKNGYGFLGLNLHYLSGGARKAVIENFMLYASNKKMDETTRMRINYDLIKFMGKLHSVVKPSIHRYLFAHCRSHFIEVFPDEYDIAIQLPVEEWVFKR